MKRRLATLATLARLDDRRLREAAAELVPLQDRVARLAAEAQELDRRRQQESTVTLVEAMPYLGRFLVTLRRETDRIASDRVKADKAEDSKREQVLDAWRDLRPKESLQTKLLDHARLERLRVEQAELDERGVQAHVRRSRLSQLPTALE